MIGTDGTVQETEVRSGCEGFCTTDLVTVPAFYLPAAYQILPSAFRMFNFLASSCVVVPYLRTGTTTQC
jgi:hypothetical protein